MSALHNWIIDAERYRISFFLLFSITLSLSLTHILAFKLKCCHWIYFHFPGFFFVICKHSDTPLSSPLFRFLYHTPSDSSCILYNAQYSLIKCCTQRLREKAGMKKKPACSSAVTAHSGGYCITVCCWGNLCEHFPIKKRWLALWRDHWVGTVLADRPNKYHNQDGTDAALMLSWWL